MLKVCFFCNSRKEVTEFGGYFFGERYSELCLCCIKKIKEYSNKIVDLLYNDEEYQFLENEIRDTFKRQGASDTALKAFDSYVSERKEAVSRKKVIMSEGTETETFIPAAKIQNHRITSDYSFNNFKIKKYNGLVSGNSIIEDNVLIKYVKPLKFFLGNREEFEAKRREKYETQALEKMVVSSIKKGGNAVIGVNFDYVSIGKNMVVVSVNGSSVLIEKEA